MLDWITPLIFLLPVAASLWIGLAMLFGCHQGEAGEKPTARIAVGASLLSLLAVISVIGLRLSQHLPETVVLGQWFDSGFIQIDLRFLLDELALVMLGLVGLISFLVTRFSVNYLHREAGFQRFFMLLSLFNSAMLLLVLAGNAVLSFVAWELLGLSSYLLIAYRWQRATATNNALRAFLTNRLGDVGFIIALVFSFFWLGSSDWAVVNAHENVSNLQVSLIVGGFVLAALIKSAQFPFSSWISRALEGPTPSSTVFYGALMVHAGVFLLLRIEPLLVNSHVFQIFLLFIGFSTVVYGYFTGLVQNDVKTVLIYSVITQVGLMVIAIGLGWTTWVVLHLVAHALWRTYQFLHAPSYLHQITRPSPAVAQWLQQRRFFYTVVLQRFWLDNLVDWLFTRPVKALARDVQLFEEQVMVKIAGKAMHQHRISSLSQWEANQRQQQSQHSGEARGLLGRFMQWFAYLSQLFEDKLILRSSSEGLLGLLNHISRYLEIIEGLLVQPRYLVLLILLTFILIV